MIELTFNQVVLEWSDVENEDRCVVEKKNLDTEDDWEYVGETVDDDTVIVDDDVESL